MSNPGSPPGPHDENSEQGHHGDGADQARPSSPPPPPPSGAEPATAEQPPRRRRALTVGILAAVVVLLVPGAVFAWRALDGGGPQPHDVLPADSIGYVRIDMDPSAAQKVEAFRFLRKFPGFKEATGITDEDDDLRELFIDEFSDATGCDLDFAEDVEPWLGHRVGAAALPPSDDSGAPGFALALQADDEDAARETFEKAQDCGGDEASIGLSYADGYLIITDTQENADAYVESAQESSLADNEDFAETMDLLGDPGVVSFWVSGTGMFDVFGEALENTGPLPGDESLPGMEESRELLEDSYQSFAATFRFDDSYAEIAAVTTGDIYTDMGTGGVQADVPDDTSLLMGVAGGGDALLDNWDEILESYPDATEQIDALEAQTGFTLPDDLATLLGDSLLVALDGNGLDVPAVFMGDFSSLNAGVKVATDAGAFSEIWAQIQDMAAQAGESLDGVPVHETDDGYIVASNDEYAATLGEGGALADADVYTTAVRDAADADAVFFVNFDSFEDAVLDTLGEQGIGEDTLESIRTLQALGVSARSHDGYAEMTMRLTAD